MPALTPELDFLGTSRRAAVGAHGTVSPFTRQGKDKHGKAATGGRSKGRVAWSPCSRRRQALFVKVLGASAASINMAPAKEHGVSGSQLYDTIRQQFLYFSTPEPNGRKKLAFMENAGGSQVPVAVADAVRDHMLHSYAQLGAGYAMSTRATDMVDRAHAFMEVFMNAEGVGKVALGAATSNLLAMVGDCYGQVLGPSDEIVIHEANHEANIGPWVRAAARAGCPVKWWSANPHTLEQAPLGELRALLTPQTRIVAVTHVSNILGEITDVGAVVKLVRECAGPRCRVVVDGVAYAPHRAIDVKQWGVDWYVFSTYKVFGPHMAALYGSTQAWADVEHHGPNHFWIDGQDVPYKFELGGPSHEACAGLLAVWGYLEFLAAARDGAEEMRSTRLSPGGGETWSREVVEAAFGLAETLEQPLQEMLVKYLQTKPQVTLVGPPTGDPKARVSTVSFVHHSKQSSEISTAIQEAGFAVRNGNMYTYRMLKALEPHVTGLSVDEGVVRASLLHYNTPEEVRSLCAALENIL